jgi:DNA-directed RNA polymerase alpha subunit
MNISNYNREELLNLDLEYLNFSEILYMNLYIRNINCFSDLLNSSFDYILNSKGIGRNAFNEIIEKLNYICENTESYEIVRTIKYSNLIKSLIYLKNVYKEKMQLFGDIHNIDVIDDIDTFKKNIYEVDIDYLHLTSKIRNALKKNNIINISDLLNITYEQFISFENISSKSFDEVYSKLKLVSKKLTNPITKYEIKTSNLFSSYMKYEEEKLNSDIKLSSEFCNLGFSTTTYNYLNKMQIDSFDRLIYLTYNELDILSRHISTNDLLTIKNIVLSFDKSEINLKDDLGSLGLSSRTYNVLRRAGIHTINELLDKSDEQINLIKYIGNQSLYEIKSVRVKMNKN